MEKIKTYPLQFTETALKKVKDKATMQGISMKEFMHNAINKAMEEPNE